MMVARRPCIGSDMGAWRRRGAAVPLDFVNLLHNLSIQPCQGDVANAKDMLKH